MRAVLVLAAAALYGQSSPDPNDALARAQARIVTTMLRLPKYACVQTIDRTYYAPSSSRHLGTSCDQMSADKRPLAVTKTDRLRLDVAQAGGYEIHSWPGARRFDMTEIDQVVEGGPFGTGSFGGYLVVIFDNDTTKYSYQGEKTRDGKSYLTYHYSVPLAASSYEILSRGSRLTTAFSGTFEIDEASLDIARITVETSELPAETELCEASSTLDYQSVQIGDGSFLLPKQSQLRMLQRDGGETNSSTVFTGCREFLAKSEVTFGQPTDMPATSAAPAAQSRAPLPGGLEIELRLTKAIDTDTAAAGDPVEASVTHAVRAPNSREILIPAGAVAHGRISLVEHHFAPTEYLVVGIAFESLETGAEAAPFAAHMQRQVTAFATARDTRVIFGPPDSFVFVSEKRHRISAGTVSEWVTVSRL